MAIQDLDARIAESLRKRGVEPTPEMIDKVRAQVGMRRMSRYVPPPEPAQQAPVQVAPTPEGGSFVDIAQGAAAQGFADLAAALRFPYQQAAGALGMEPDAILNKMPLRPLERALSGYMEGVAASPENQPLPGEENTFKTNLARAVGSAGAFVPGAVLGTLAGGPVGAAIVAGSQGAATEGTRGYIETLADTGNEETAWQSYFLNALGGATEGLDAMIPAIGKLGKVLVAVNKGTGGALTKGLISGAAKGAAINFTQETGQELWAEQVDKWLGVNPEQARSVSEAIKDLTWRVGLPAAVIGGPLGTVEALADRALAKQQLEAAKAAYTPREGLKNVGAAQEAPGSTQPGLDPQVESGANVQPAPSQEPSDAGYQAAKVMGATGEVEIPAEFKGLEEYVKRRGGKLRAVTTAPESRFQGYTSPDGTEILVNINRPDAAVEEVVLGHEMLHSLKTFMGGEWESVRGAIEEADPEGLQKYEAQALERQPDMDLGISTEEGVSYYAEEVLSPYIRALVKDPKALEKIATDNRTTFRKIVEAVLDVLNDFGAQFNTQKAEIRRVLGEAGVIGRKMPPVKAAKLAQRVVAALDTIPEGVKARARQQQVDALKATAREGMFERNLETMRRTQGNENPNDPYYETVLRQREEARRAELLRAAHDQRMQEIGQEGAMRNAPGREELYDPAVIDRKKSGQLQVERLNTIRNDEQLRDDYRASIPKSMTEAEPVPTRTGYGQTEEAERTPYYRTMADIDREAGQQKVDEYRKAKINESLLDAYRGSIPQGMMDRPTRRSVGNFSLARAQQAQDLLAGARRKFVDYLDWTTTRLEKVTGKPADEIVPLALAKLRKGLIAYSAKKDLLPRLKHLKAEMKRLKVPIVDIDRFMQARVSPLANKIVNERRANDTSGDKYDSGVSAKDAAAIEAELKKNPKHYLHIVQLVKLVDDFNDLAMKVNVASGKTSAEQAAAMRAAYDPAQHGLANPHGFKTFYGALKDAPEIDGLFDVAPNTGRGISMTGAEYQSRLGRKEGTTKLEDLGSPVGNAVTALQNALIRQVKQAEQREWAKFVRELKQPDFAVVHESLPTREYLGEDGFVHTMPDMSQLREDNVVPFLDDGKWKAIEFKGDNKRIAQDLRAMTVAPPWELPAKVTRTMTSLLTRHDPTFMLRNAPRDIGWAIIAGFAKYDGGFVKEMLKQIPTALRELRAAQRGSTSAMLERYNASGAQISAFDMMNEVDAVKVLTQEPGPHDIRRFFAQWERIVGGWNDVVENMTRYAAFRTAVQNGMSDQQAALVAKEGVALNFEQTGEVGRRMNSLYGFFSASVNGADAMARLVFNKDPVVRARAQHAVGYLVALGAINELMNYLYSDEGDDGEPIYDNVSDFEKNRNLLIVNRTGEYVKIPLPQGFNAVWAMGRNAMAALLGYRTASDAAMNSVSFMSDALNPFGSGPLLQQLSFTATDPLVQMLTNESFTGSKIAPDLEQFGRPGKPAHELFWANTGDLPKWIAKGLSNATETDDSGRGMLDIRPDMIEHFVSSVFGGAGRAAADAAGTLESAATGDFKPKDAIVLRSFLGAATPYATDKRYRTVVREMDAAKLRYDELRRTGEGKRALEWRRDHLPLFQAIGQRSMIERALDRIPNTPENEERRRSLKARFLSSYKSLTNG